MPKYLKGMFIFSITMVVTSIARSLIHLCFPKGEVHLWSEGGLLIVWCLAFFAFVYDTIKHIKSTRKDS